MISRILPSTAAWAEYFSPLKVWAFTIVPAANARRAQHHIPRDGVGENAAAPEVGVDVQETADDAQEAGRGQAFGIVGLFSDHFMLRRSCKIL